jgi:hypothetical protein
MVLMNLYNNALLARHPLLRPLADNVRLPRPAVRIWADASGKGYGAHLGPADQPIATFQQKLLTSLPSPDGKTPFELHTKLVNCVHEAAALYLGLVHFRPLLRGAKIVAHTDNNTVFAAFGKRGTKGTKGLRDILAIVDAVKEIVRADDMNLEVKFIEGKNNGLADALSRFAKSSSNKYPGIIKFLMKNRVNGSKAADELIKKIAAASSVHQYPQDEAISNTIPQDELDQELPSTEAGTGAISSWELVKDDFSSSEMTIHVLPVSAQSIINELSETDGFEQAELPTETTPDDFNALFLAMEKSKAAKAKKVRARGRATKTTKVKALKPVVAMGGQVKEAEAGAMMTPSKEEEATAMATSTKETKMTKALSATSGPALIEAAQELIKQAQEFVKAAKKLVKAAGKKK